MVLVLADRELNGEEDWRTARSAADLIDAVIDDVHVRLFPASSLRSESDSRGRETPRTVRSYVCCRCCCRGWPVRMLCSNKRPRERSTARTRYACCRRVPTPPRLQAGSFIQSAPAGLSARPRTLAYSIHQTTDVRDVCSASAKSRTPCSMPHRHAACNIRYTACSAHPTTSERMSAGRVRNCGRTVRRYDRLG